VVVLRAAGRRRGAAGQQGEEQGRDEDFHVGVVK
jgi:hypothetical protein